MAKKTMNCDLCVIGAGGCGLVAGVKAADLTGKKVIFLEKGKKAFGGSSTFAHGMAITDSTFQKKAGEAVSDPPSVSGQFFDWVCSKGDVERYFEIVPMEKVKMKEFGNLIMPDRVDRYKGHPDHAIGPGWLGTLFTDVMIECCEKMDIPIITGARAKEFVMATDGSVSGVLADTGEGELQVNFKACLVAAGGFGSNVALLTELFPETFNGKSRRQYSPPTCTGDWIDMAKGIGASVDVSNARVALGGPAHHPYSYSIYRAMQFPEVVNVNLNGERWYDETGGLFNGGEALGKQPKGESYAVVDSDVLEIVWKKALADPNEESDLPLQRKLKEDIAYEVALDEGGTKGNHTKKADTLIDLALKMDIDPEAFVETIQKYNQYCAEGKDPDFGKDAEYLKPIVKPPFYAFWGQRFTEVTHGGIAVNEEGQMLDTKGNVIPGLYAGGDCTTIYASSGSGGSGGAPGGGQGGPDGGTPPQGGMPEGAGGPGGQGGVPGGQDGSPSGDMAPQGGMPSDTGGFGGSPGAFGSGRGRGGGGLGGAITFGYSTGISIADYLKSV
jgi:fumarate reductase flavoprotein subunit